MLPTVDVSRRASSPGGGGGGLRRSDSISGPGVAPGVGPTPASNMASPASGRLPSVASSPRASFTGVYSNSSSQLGLPPASSSPVRSSMPLPTVREDMSPPSGLPHGDLGLAHSSPRRRPGTLMPVAASSDAVGRLGGRNPSKLSRSGSLGDAMRASHNSPASPYADLFQAARKAASGYGLTSLFPLDSSRDTSPGPSALEERVGSVSGPAATSDQIGRDSLRSGYAARGQSPHSPHASTLDAKPGPLGGRGPNLSPYVQRRASPARGHPTERARSPSAAVAEAAAAPPKLPRHAFEDAPTAHSTAAPEPGSGRSGAGSSPGPVDRASSRQGPGHASPSHPHTGSAGPPKAAHPHTHNHHPQPQPQPQASSPPARPAPPSPQSPRRSQAPAASAPASAAAAAAARASVSPAKGSGAAASSAGAGRGAAAVAAKPAPARSLSSLSPARLVPGAKQPIAGPSAQALPPGSDELLLRLTRLEGRQDALERKARAAAAAASAASTSGAGSGSAPPATKAAGVARSLQGAPAPQDLTALTAAVQELQRRLGPAGPGQGPGPGGGGGGGGVAADGVACSYSSSSAAGSGTGASLASLGSSSAASSNSSSPLAESPSAASAAAAEERLAAVEAQLKQLLAAQAATAAAGGGGGGGKAAGPAKAPAKGQGRGQGQAKGAQLTLAGPAAVASVGIALGCVAAVVLSRRGRKVAGGAAAPSLPARQAPAMVAAAAPLPQPQPAATARAQTPPRSSSRISASGAAAAVAGGGGASAAAVEGRVAKLDSALSRAVQRLERLEKTVSDQGSASQRLADSNKKAAKSISVAAAAADAAKTAAAEAAAAVASLRSALTAVEKRLGRVEGQPPSTPSSSSRPAAAANGDALAAAVAAAVAPVQSAVDHLRTRLDAAPAQLSSPLGRTASDAAVAAAAAAAAATAAAMQAQASGSAQADAAKLEERLAALDAAVAELRIRPPPPSLSPSPSLQLPPTLTSSQSVPLPLPLPLSLLSEPSTPPRSPVTSAMPAPAAARGALEAQGQRLTTLESQLVEVRAEVGRLSTAAASMALVGERVSDMLLDVTQARAASEGVKGEIEWLVGQLNQVKSTATAAATAAKQAAANADNANANANAAHDGLAALHDAFVASGGGGRGGGAGGGGTGELLESGQEPPPPTPQSVANGLVQARTADGDSPGGSLGRAGDADAAADADASGGAAEASSPTGASLPLARRPGRGVSFKLSTAPGSLQSYPRPGAAGDGTGTEGYETDDGASTVNGGSPSHRSYGAVGAGSVASTAGRISYNGGGSVGTSGHGGANSTNWLETVLARLSDLEEVVEELQRKMTKGLQLRVTRDELREMLAAVDTRIEGVASRAASRAVSRATSRAASSRSRAGPGGAVEPIAKSRSRLSEPSRERRGDGDGNEADSEAEADGDGGGGEALTSDGGGTAGGGGGSTTGGGRAGGTPSEISLSGGVTDPGAETSIGGGLLGGGGGMAPSLTSRASDRNPDVLTAVRRDVALMEQRLESVEIAAIQAATGGAQLAALAASVKDLQAGAAALRAELRALAAELSVSPQALAAAVAAAAAGGGGTGRLTGDGVPLTPRRGSNGVQLRDHPVLKGLDEQMVLLSHRLEVTEELQVELERRARQAEARLGALEDTLGPAAVAAA